EDAARVRVQVEDYSGVWLPTIGSTEDVDFGGSRADRLLESFYFNRTSDTGLVAARLRGGDAYTLVASPEPDVVDDDAAPSESMLQLTASRLQMPEATGVPDIVASLASEYTQGATGDYERVSMIATALSSYGYFSHGLEGEAPSRPGHGAARLITMLDSDQMTGDAEQYAAAMALMVRALGLPARVVMGFDVSEATTGADGALAVTGSDVTAWVEVPFEGHGWLPFFPTPEEDQVPQVQNPDPQDRPEPQVLQPPEPPQEPPVVPPLDRGEAPRGGHGRRADPALGRGRRPPAAGAAVAVPADGGAQGAPLAAPAGERAARGQDRRGLGGALGPRARPRCRPRHRSHPAGGRLRLRQRAVRRRHDAAGAPRRRGCVRARAAVAGRGRRLLGRRRHGRPAGRPRGVVASTAPRALHAEVVALEVRRVRPTSA